FLSTPIFAVGRATGETCRSQLHGGWVDSCDIRGEESGNATTLLPEIIRFCRECQSRTGARPRLAFFCGDQRRDTLPRGVGHSDCAELCEIVSYTTAGRSQSKVGEALLGALARAAAAAAAAACHRRDAQREQGTVVWLVLFSPSGARVVVPIAQRLARQGVLGADAARPGGAVVCRFAAIGETTAAEIAALGVDAQSIVRASEPDEQGVGRALRLAEARPPPVAGPLAPQEAH
ncbi:uroporphyrinogen-III synthase, partial [Coemansia biformis]